MLHEMNLKPSSVALHLEGVAQERDRWRQLLDRRRLLHGKLSALLTVGFVEMLTFRMEFYPGPSPICMGG
jgi:hypothetical protein